MDTHTLVLVLVIFAALLVLAALILGWANNIEQYMSNL